MYRRRLGEVPAASICCFGTPIGRTTVRATNGLLVSPAPKPWFSSSSSSSSGYSAKAPSRQPKSWESGAKLVQNTATVENKYLEQIRDAHDPSQHLKTIEDELKGTIGIALGKQAQKIHTYAKLMDRERKKYEELLVSVSVPAVAAEKDRRDDELRECAIAHNDYRKECLHARWELVVHRQAVGFTIGNHKFVHDSFPIGDALPLEDETSARSDEQQTSNTSNGQTQKKVFTDQLDWWSRIGRWK